MRSLIGFYAYGVGVTKDLASLAGAAMDAQSWVWGQPSNLGDSLGGVLRVIAWGGAIILVGAAGAVAWLVRHKKSRGNNVTI